jgi:FtsP/CotA-like multicopper oxidase with cupredoxin domain
VTVQNAMQGYTSPLQPRVYNSFRDPYITNLHTHGLHVSGDTGADDVSVEILPGQRYNYTYIIPCDHAGESCVCVCVSVCVCVCVCVCIHT